MITVDVMHNSPRTAPKLPLKLFEIACEAIESEMSAACSRATAAGKAGDVAGVERAEVEWMALQDRLEALIESQLAAAGERRPSTTALDATLAA